MHTTPPPLPFSRSYFLRSAGAATAAAALTPAILRSASPSESLNIAAIGVGGKGVEDLAKTVEVGGVNVVALADVDSNALAEAAKKHGAAKTYADFRKMLDAHKDIDAVLISAPDHIHYPATMMAIKLGKHVYCQKPLTNSIWEARQLTEAARKYKVVTQMGNQGQSNDGWRQLCEYVWSGAIGPVREVHAWTDRAAGWWPQGVDRPAGEDPVPPNLNWDLWLGPAPHRPYKHTWGDDQKSRWKQVYHPGSWRGWWDFGSGALGDMACHILNGAYWALKLGAPTKVEIVKSTDLKPETAPLASTLRYHFPARENMPPCTVTWYDGGKLNPPPRPTDHEANHRMPDNGSLFVGERGKILAPTYGESIRPIPETFRRSLSKPAESIPRIRNPKTNKPDHYYDFVQGCKGGRAPCSNFDVAGPFTEMVLLGNVALRAGKTIEWDAQKLTVTNDPAASRFIKKDYRQGWDISA